MSARRAVRSAGFIPAAGALWLGVALLVQERGRATPHVTGATANVAGPSGNPFLTSHECLACHNGLTTKDGEDVSIGSSWRASMMANSSRDPYWQAAVRREVMDHPLAKDDIEDECAICHMPMARTKANASGERGKVFAHLARASALSEDRRLAADGVSCTACHQIGAERLGTRESFSGRFVISAPARDGARRMFGQFEIDPARQSVMRSATGMTPAAGAHIRESEMCATCHTLYTRVLAATGEVLAEFPEQVPFLEWRHSAFAAERQSCQTCHMPEVPGPTRIASVLGDERAGLSRHTFFGGNFFMLRMLNRYRTELGVEALPQELDAAAHATTTQLRNNTATLSLQAATSNEGELTIDVTVRNLTGHKLPTAYPSRRAWLHLNVRDRDNQSLFSSGAIDPSGLIDGNDNDADAEGFEPHYEEIRRGDQVQIYESIMQDGQHRVTTGLLRATGYAKDNRLLPRGFEKGSAPPEAAVIGDANDDRDFTAGQDRVRYVVGIGGRRGPYRIDAQLRYQPIAFRWAHNLKEYDAAETRRFVAWFDTMSTGSSVLLAEASVTVEGK